MWQNCMCIMFMWQNFVAWSTHSNSLEISAAFVHRVRIGPQDTVGVTIANDDSESFISSGLQRIFYTE